LGKDSEYFTFPHHQQQYFFQKKKNASPDTKKPGIEHGSPIFFINFASWIDN
jgi:hypothetical protein